MLFSIIAIFGFALFDYFGYIFSYKRNYVNDKIINPYRVFQVIIQIIITVSLLIFADWKQALIFNIFWWGWLADWIFYFYCFLFNYNNSRKDCLQPFQNCVTWAWWTYFGLIFFKKGKVIKWNALIFFGLFTIFISLIIQYIL